MTKNHPADSKIGYPLKIDYRADWTHESNPTACELKLNKGLKWPSLHDIIYYY